jgi:mono/diheme cytochrome c family protein
MNRVLIAGLVVLGFLVLARPALAQDAAKGAKLFTDNKCAMCHSIAGKGNPKGPLDEVGSKLSSAEIHDWITDPATMAAKAKADRKPAMATMAATFKKMSKEDVDSLVAYLSSLKKK